MGILSLLDEESLFPKATDITFVNKLHSQFNAKGHPKYIKPRFSKTAFGVSHYAGDVEYETAQWLDKNKDPLADDLVSTFSKSSQNLIAELFLENITGVGFVEEKGKRGKGANFITVASQYKEQLHKLITTLYSTIPHFIRCILPNSNQQAGIIQDAVVLDQLRCNGVLEGIRITRRGFPNRVVYAEFLKRYYLLGKTTQRVAQDPRASTSQLLDELKIDPQQYRFGVTKVFFKAGILAQIEEMREKKISDILITIQASARGFLARQQFKRMTEKTVAVKIIQRNIRAWLSFKDWNWGKLFAKAKPLLKRRNFEKEIDERNKKIADLSAQIEQDNKSKSALEQTIKELEAQVTDMQTKLKKERDAFVDIEDEKHLLEDEKAENEKKLKKMQAELDSLNKDLDDLEKDKDATTGKVRQLQEQLDFETKARSSLEDLKVRHETELEKLKALHDEESGTIIKLQRAKDGLEQQVEELLDQVDQESKAKLALEKVKKKLEGEVEELMDKYENESKNKGNLDKDKKKVRKGNLFEISFLFSMEEKRNEISCSIQRNRNVSLGRVAIYRIEDQVRSRGCCSCSRRSHSQEIADGTSTSEGRSRQWGQERPIPRQDQEGSRGWLWGLEGPVGSYHGPESDTREGQEEARGRFRRHER